MVQSLEMTFHVHIRYLLTSRLINILHNRKKSKKKCYRYVKVFIVNRTRPRHRHWPQNIPNNPKYYNRRLAMLMTMPFGDIRRSFLHYQFHLTLHRRVDERSHITNHKWSSQIIYYTRHPWKGFEHMIIYQWVWAVSTIVEEIKSTICYTLGLIASKEKTIFSQN